MTVPPAACSFHVCRLALCPAISMTPHASRWLRPVCASSALENPIHKVHTCTHRTSLRCTLLGRCVRQRPCGEPPGRRCTVRRTPTCTHTASLSVRLLHEHTNTHTGALRLHGRRTRAGVLGSCSGRLTPALATVMASRQMLIQGFGGSGGYLAICLTCIYIRLCYVWARFCIQFVYNLSTICIQNTTRSHSLFLKLFGCLEALSVTLESLLEILEVLLEQLLKILLAASLCELSQ